MSDETVVLILRKLDELQAEVHQLRAGAAVVLPEDAVKAQEARAVAAARGYHTVDSLASVLGIHPRTISSRCKARVIRTLRVCANGYRIPLSEESRLTGANGF
jgi:hypothetical protein